MGDETLGAAADGPQGSLRRWRAGARARVFRRARRGSREGIGSNRDNTGRARLITGYSALRIGYAVALLAAPARTARPWLGEVAEEAGTTIAVRGLGARDLVLSVGALASTASGRSSRAWLAACAASDAVDLLATLVADGDRLPAKSKPGTVAAAGMFGAAAAALAASES